MSSFGMINIKKKHERHKVSREHISVIIYNCILIDIYLYTFEQQEAGKFSY